MAGLSLREAWLLPLFKLLGLGDKDVFEEILSQMVARDRRCGDRKPLVVYLATVFEKSRTILYGDRPYLERYKVSSAFFENLSSVEELKDLTLKYKQVLDYIITDAATEDTSTSIKFFNFSVSEDFCLSVRNAMDSQNWSLLENLILPIALALLTRAAVYYGFVISAVLLLSMVYQYLIGLIDKGGGKIYSSDSLEFRSVYISIVLFQGAYIWIKFRDVAPESNRHPSPGLHRKSRKNELGETVYYGNFEPRFKPPGSKNYISVGSYEQEEDAKIVYHILAFYYGKKDVQGELPLMDGCTYSIPGMTEKEQTLDPEEKKKVVKRKVKIAFEEYQLWGCLFNPEVTHPTGDAIPPHLPEGPDAGARVIVPSGSSGVQADEAHPFQLGNQGGDLVLDASPINSSNVGPGTEGMQHHTNNDTLSGGVGGDASNFTLPGSSTRSQPEAATNIAVNGTGVSGEQPLKPQRQEGPLQENQAGDFATNMISDDLNLRRQVKELQRQVKESQHQAEYQQLKIQCLETENSLLKSQEQFHRGVCQKQQTQIQDLESRFLEFQHQQQHSLLQIQRLNSRIQEQNFQISELDDETELLRSREHALKRRCTCLTSRHDSQN